MQEILTLKENAVLQSRQEGQSAIEQSLFCCFGRIKIEKEVIEAKL